MKVIMKEWALRKIVNSYQWNMTELDPYYVYEYKYGNKSMSPAIMDSLMRKLQQINKEGFEVDNEYLFDNQFNTINYKEFYGKGFRFMDTDVLEYKGFDPRNGNGRCQYCGKNTMQLEYEKSGCSGCNETGYYTPFRHAYQLLTV